MALIADKTFVLLPTTDRYLSINGEEWVRKLIIDDDWDRLRVGFMCAIVPDGTNNLISATLQVGLCNNTTDTLRTAVTQNGFFNLITSENQTLTYNAGGGNPYFTIPSSTTGKRLASNTTLISADATDHYITTTTGSIQRRTPLYIDFSKSGGFVKLFRWETASFVQQDYSINQFLDGMQQTNEPLVGGNQMAASSQISILIIEAAGVLNTLSFYWNKLGFAFEIYAVSIYRHS